MTIDYKLNIQSPELPNEQYNPRQNSANAPRIIRVPGYLAAFLAAILSTGCGRTEAPEPKYQSPASYESSTQPATSQPQESEGLNVAPDKNQQKEPTTQPAEKDDSLEKKTKKAGKWFGEGYEKRLSDDIDRDLKGKF